MVSLNKPIPGVTADYGVAPAGQDWASLINAALDALNGAIGSGASPYETLTLVEDYATGITTTPVAPSTTTGTPSFGTPAEFGNSLGTGATFTYASLIAETTATTTVECWFRYTAAPTGTVLLWSLGTHFWVGVDTSGKLLFRPDGASGGGLSPATVCDSAWHHLAVEFHRTSGATVLDSIWLDGASISVGAAGGGQTWVADFTIGGFSDGSFNNTGRIDEMRVSSVARYSTGFTPAVSAFTVDSTTLLLVHLDSTGTGLAPSGGSGLTYPPRPSVAAGRVIYVGTDTPTDMLTGDRWYQI